MAEFCSYSPGFCSFDRIEAETKDNDDEPSEDSDCCNASESSILILSESACDAPVHAHVAGQNFEATMRMYA